MDNLIRSVTSLIADEYERASKKFGLVSNSDHESYAVILEEIDQMSNESSLLVSKMGEFWELVKDKKGSDRQKINALYTVNNHAVLLACEAIQIAAMAYKAQRTIQARLEE